MKSLEVALAATDQLGEGPWWSVADQALWRVDILAKLLHRWVPATDTSEQWDLSDAVGFAVPTDDGKVVAGLGTDLCLIDLGTGEREVLATAAPGRSDIRINDGKTDRFGRVWAGTMPDDQSPSGEFYRLDPTGLTPTLGGIKISNGLGWSPDSQTMYYTDSGVRTIWAFDFDPATAAMSNRRVFAVDDDCEPDGLTVDSEGGVWSAKWNGNRVVGYAPNGVITEVVESPVSRPTSCMFGGPDLDVLYVTSASVGLSAEELAATPAGSVLAVRPGVRGVGEVVATIPVNE